ncbi:MAG: protein-L-isoaspartate(D-aspartate) O-methyltransferase [Candidatus Omnitrophota bacterium]
MLKQTDYSFLRRQMVETQLIRRGITDKKVISAFNKVDRHEFVLPKDLNLAYQDSPLSIGENQTISQPYMAALMTQCLELKGDEKILEIGTGCGYQTAILAELVKTVYSIERIKTLSERASKTLKKLGYSNIVISTGDGTLGWEEHAPYDGIIVTAAASKIPEIYVKQLKVPGKLVIPVGDRFSQALTVLEKNENQIETHSVCGCVFVPLIGKNGWGE